MNNWTKCVAVVGGGAVIGAAYYFPSFIAFLVVGLFLILTVFVVYMVYGFWVYINEWKNMIRMDPEDALKNVVIGG